MLVYNNVRNNSGINPFDSSSYNKDPSKTDFINIRDRSFERSTRLPPKKLTIENINFLKSLGFRVKI